MKNILLILIFLPIISGATLMSVRSSIAKYAAFAVVLFEMFLSFWVFYIFKHAGENEFLVNMPWIREWGINIELALDGVNILMVLLTGLALPFVIVAGWDKHYHNYGLMDGMALILQGALMGVFLTTNAFVYYIFWEMTLIPIYLILLLWGGENRMRVTLKFFIYTLAGSLFMLVALIFIYLKTPGNHSFSLLSLMNLNLTESQQSWLFLAFMLAFMIKTPIFPFHTWQPETYTQAPSAGTMLLGGLMSKMGLFSILRWVFPILPWAVKEYGPYIILLSVFTLLYASVIALRQKNIKTLFAYSSMAHLAMIMAAIFTLNQLAIQGAIIQLFAHGVIIIALFFVADVFKTRTDTQLLESLGGIKDQAPVFAGFYLVILLASIGFPLTSNFTGEFLMITGMVKYNIWIASAAGISIILSAAYMLVSFKKAMLGSTVLSDFLDVQLRERILFGCVIAFVFFVGVFPSVFLQATEKSADLLTGLFQLL
jgi:NADH-quinone oxidoreductase subunit M